MGYKWVKPSQIIQIVNTVSNEVSKLWACNAWSRHPLQALKEIKEALEQV